MLKWLKQKPIGNGQETSEKMTTDDPLATIQVHPINTKRLSLKSLNSSSANEIYAVSRFVGSRRFSVSFNDLALFLAKYALK